MRRILFVALLAVGVLTGSVAPATGSNAAIVIPFEKQGGSGSYTGTACDGGTIEMQLTESYVTGNVQHFTATVRLDCGAGRSLTAVLDGRFNFSTEKAVLNGTVVDGWLEGARVHEESQLVAYTPLTFVGTVTLMPASAG